MARATRGKDGRARPERRPPRREAEKFRAIGQRDAHDLAVELVASYEGTAVLTNALGQPELMTSQARRLKRWIDALHA